MAIERVTKDSSPEAMAELRGVIAARHGDDIVSVEDELQAHAFMQKCAREMDEKDRVEKMEHRATEVLEVFAATTAGALSTWKSGMVPLGAFANYMLGGTAKVGSFVNPDHRALRVACRASKVLFHSQLAITTRNIILEKP